MPPTDARRRVLDLMGEIEEVKLKRNSASRSGNATLRDMYETDLLRLREELETARYEQARHNELI